MAAFGVLGSRLYVGDTPLTNIEGAADELMDFSSLTTTVEVGLIESIGNFGKKFDLVTFQAIATGRMYKFKGGYNQGNLALVVASSLDDVGQLMLNGYAQAQDQFTYPFKMTLNGAASAYDTLYFGGKVFSYEYQLGSVNNVTKANIQIEINTDIFFT